MTHIDDNSMLEFAQLLLEASDRYELLTDRTVMDKEAESLISFKVGKEKAPVRLFKEGDVTHGFAYLQPFREFGTNSLARKWFYDLCTSTPFVLLKDLMVKTVELAVDKSSTDPDQLEVINKVLKRVNKTTLSDIKKIAPSELGQIYYNKSSKTASLNMFHKGPSLKENYKLSEKTLDVIIDLIAIFLNDDFAELEDFITYTATLVNIPETEAKLQVTIAALELLAPHVLTMLERDIKVEKMMQHLRLLDGYRKLHMYLSADTSLPAGPDANPIAPGPYTAPGKVAPVAKPTPSAPKTNSPPSLKKTTGSVKEGPLRPMQITQPHPVGHAPGYAPAPPAPGYAPTGYTQPGYAQPGYAPAGYAQPGYSSGYQAQQGYGPPPVQYQQPVYTRPANIYDDTTPIV